MTAMSEEDGWFLTGFTLSKEPPATLAETPAETKQASAIAPAAEGAAAEQASAPAAVETPETIKQ